MFNWWGKQEEEEEEGGVKGKNGASRSVPTRPPAEEWKREPIPPLFPSFSFFSHVPAFQGWQLKEGET